MLKYRIITALILIPLVLMGIFYLPPLAFSIISAIIFLLAAWEWSGLLHYNRNQRILFLCTLLLVDALLLWPPTIIVLTAATLSWIALLYFVVRYDQFIHYWSRFPSSRAILGIWLLATSWYGLNIIHALDHGALWLLFLLLFVWGADTGAYFIGHWLGKRKLAPQISPGKSIAGVIGGSITSVLIAIIGGLTFSISGVNDLWFILLALLTSLVSVLGDLVESMVKRQCAAKDSSHLLPGHGGILDRIDSLLSTAPIVALYLLIWR